MNTSPESRPVSFGGLLIVSNRNRCFNFYDRSFSCMRHEGA